MIVEIDAGHKSRSAARYRVKRATQQHALAPENALQRPLHGGNHARAADQQHGLYTVLVVTALAGIVQSPANGMIHLGECLVFVEQALEASARKAGG